MIRQPLPTYTFQQERKMTLIGLCHLMLGRTRNVILTANYATQNTRCVWTASNSHLNNNSGLIKWVYACQ